MVILSVAILRHFYKTRHNVWRILHVKLPHLDWHGADHQECQLILRKLADEPDVQQWREMADNNTFEKFQTDHYGYTVLRQGWDDLTSKYQSIILVLEGKMMMESYGKQFSYFEHLISRAYPEFQLASLIKVEIA